MSTEVINCFLNIVFSGHLAAIDECFRIYGNITDGAIRDIRNLNLKHGPSYEFQRAFEANWNTSWQEI